MVSSPIAFAPHSRGFLQFCTKIYIYLICSTVLLGCFDSQCLIILFMDIHWIKVFWITNLSTYHFTLYRPAGPLNNHTGHSCYALNLITKVILLVSDFDPVISSLPAAPSMHALSALGVPYFKIQHYYNLTQSIFDIEHDADWKTLLYKLQGEALLVETAHNFYEPHPGVEWTRVYAEDFARTMQTVFGSPRLKENYAYLSVFNANITPVEFADSYMEGLLSLLPR